MISPSVFQKVIIIGTVYIMAGCSLNAEPPAIGEIQVEPSTTITTGDKASLTIPASGSEIKFEWSVLRGSLSDSTQPSVIYTAPDSPGLDTVTVKVTNSGGEIIKNINFEVVEPPPFPEPTSTITPIPKDTPTSTPVPEPVACNSPRVTRDVFPQLADVNGQFPFDGPLTEPRFVCQAVFDIFHNEPMAVRIEYQKAENNFGFWGFGIPNGYDATSYREICFWAYAQKPNQSFRLKMKDTSNKENGPIMTIEKANQWTKVCTDLTEFSDLGIQLASLENINLGFEQPTGSAEIWVDDFELVD